MDSEILFPNMEALMDDAHVNGTKVTTEMIRAAVQADTDELGELECDRRMIRSILLAKRITDSE